jgi:RimJ/RimL family protein N-acetyltransferase
MTKPLLHTLPDAMIGERVVVRRYADEDAPAFHRALEEVREHLRPRLPGFEQTRSYDDVLEAIRRTHAQCALRESFSAGVWGGEPAVLYGEVHLRSADWEVPSFDLSYWVHPAAQGRGYLSEAVRLFLDLAFNTLGARRVAILCEPHNARSRRLAERLGFVLEGCLRQTALGPDRQPCDLLVFSLTDKEFAHRQATSAGGE